MISKNTVGLLVFLSFLYSCHQRIEDKIAFGGKKYGGVFSYYSPEKTNIFFPLYSPTVYNQRLLSQVFEPLFILNEQGEIIPNLAKKITTSKNGQLITISLRNDVYFHNDDSFSGEKKMTAEDVKFSLDYACSRNKWNSMGGLLRDKIRGGKEYYRKSFRHHPPQGVTGIKIINDTTIRLVLVAGFRGFQKILAHPSIGVFCKKAVEYYQEDFIKHPIGTGPFILKSITHQQIILKRNPSYWKKDNLGNQLPFLSEIHIKKGEGIKSEYHAFSKKEVDIIFELPVNQLDLTFGSLLDAQKGKNLLHRVVVKKGTKINYLSFDCSNYPFNNVLVRKAFSLAIDRRKLCLEAMNGEGNFVINGFVPKNNYYEPNKIELLKHDPSAAKKLMQEAGYNINNRFPKLTLYINAQKGGVTDKWSKEIVKQLKEHIGVDLLIKYCSMDQKHKAIMSRNAKIWKSAWVPDYPDADAYFRIFYGNKTSRANEESNYNNFNNKNFDSIYRQAEWTRGLKKRRELQNELDKILIENGAIVPIFSEDLFVVVNLKVRGFNISNSGIIDFSRIYIKEVF